MPKKYYLFCSQRQQPYGADWEDVEAYTLKEIKEILIDYHLIDQPASIKGYSLEDLLEFYEWSLYEDPEFENKVDYSKLFKNKLTKK
jgi:hypothetical protein